MRKSSINQQMSRRTLLTLLGTTSLGAALAACGVRGESTVGSSPAAASSNAGSSTAPTANETAAGAGSDVPRVITLNTGQIDNALLLGILPVGSARAKGEGVIPGYLRREFGSEYDLDSVTDCGERANPDLEIIAGLEPTLICANDRTDQAILTQLKAIAPVVTGKGGGENWKEDFETVAAALGKADEAKQIMGDWDKRANEVRFVDPAPEVSFLRTKGDAFQVYGVNSMAGTVAQDLNLRRPEVQQFSDKAGLDLSAEELATADADWLFYGVQDGASDPSTTPSWSTLRAVSSGQAVPVDYEAWYMNASVVSARIIRDELVQHLG